MQINTPTNQTKKIRSRPKKANLLQTSVVLDEQLSDELFSSPRSMEEIEGETLMVNSKNENPNKKPLQNANWSKRKCLCCNTIFDSWGIGNRMCKSCK